MPKDTEAWSTQDGFRSNVLSWSLCTWTLYWAEAYEHDDSAAQRVAVREMRRNADHDAAIGMNVESIEWTRALADQAAAGRPDDDMDDWNQNSCGDIEKADR